MILRAGPERRAVAARWRFPAPWWQALFGLTIALAIFAGGALVIRGRSGIEEAPVRAGRMGRITPSKFAGHSMLCPYEETAGAQKRGTVRVRHIFAVAGFAVALVIGCHGKNAATTPPPTTPVTPTGVTSMTILGNATDASGNALGTSRSLQVTLDVVTK
jgi:hypothetical protein